MDFFGTQCTCISIALLRQSLCIGLLSCDLSVKCSCIIWPPATIHNNLAVHATNSLLRPGRERSIAISLSVCLSASISSEPLDRSSRNFLCRSPVVVARSCSCSVAIRYVLPVLWMTSHLAVMGRIAMRDDTVPESDVCPCYFVQK